MVRNSFGLVLALVAAGNARSQTERVAAPPDAAALFGARESVTNVSLSPDGTTLAYQMPVSGQGTALMIVALSAEDKPRMVLTSSPSQPERLGRCNWASSARLVCEVRVIDKSHDFGLLPVMRLFAVDAAGGNVKLLSTRDTADTRGIQLWGGSVIDWLPEEGGTVLMQRPYLPDDHLGSRSGSTKEGLGVDRIDTRTLRVTPVEVPRKLVSEYMSDGRGNVRIMGLRSVDASNQDTGIIHYFYRTPGSREWKRMGDLDTVRRIGFDPSKIDPDKNLVYGFQRDDGKQALYTMALDETLTLKKVLDHEQVDIDALITIGPRRRVIGATYATERRSSVYFDPAMERIVHSLHKALPKEPLVDIIGATPDEQKLLVAAGSDDDPGAIYVFNKANHELHLTFTVRPELDGRKLATMKPVSYPAADGTMIPGYLTLPPGRDDARGLPAIVMPHGGPESRDEWGFDWLSQFYAAQGYAVLQPNFRGSAGYGLAWFQKNGFRSWRVAIGDVLDAGRWLVKQGIADPAKLAVVGWSYGGYAALQSAVLDPALFKAVIAIAPVTDLATLKEESLVFSHHQLISDYLGSGDVARDGSPAQNAGRIKVPVLLFHGTMDVNVGYGESKLMDAKLGAAGVPHQLVTYPGLDHQLDDATARTDMLRKSNAFLHDAMHF